MSCFPVMNKARWHHLRDDRNWTWCMDWRHVRMIHAVLCCEKPTKVVEIGCYRGYSTSAILEAMEAGHVQQADLIDLAPTPELCAIIAGTACQLFPQSSEDYKGRGDCWLIDGEHEEQADRDYAKAKASGARIIVIHDSNSIESMKMHKGAHRIAKRLHENVQWYFEDKELRPGEQTERGLAIGFFEQPQRETLPSLLELVTATEIL